MSRLALACVVLGLALQAASAHGQEVRSYAYVTRVGTPDTNSVAYGTEAGKCWIHALLPRVRPTHRPVGPEPELLKGATAVEETITDDMDYPCLAFAKTWQLVTFTAGDRTEVHFILPVSPPSFWKDAFSVGLLIVLLALIKAQWGIIRGALRDASYNKLMAELDRKRGAKR